MLARKLLPETQVVVGNLLRLPAYNRLTLESHQKGETVPRFFSSAEMLGRQLGAQGTIVGGGGKPGDEGMFLVRHADGATALYHTSELVTADAYAAQHSSEGCVPLRKVVLRGIAFELYEGIAATRLPCDRLIVPLPNGSADDTWHSDALHQAVAQSTGGAHKQKLLAAGTLTELQAITTKAAGAPFKAVLFINGIRPTMDAINVTLQAAQKDRAATVVLPLRHFELFDGLEDDMPYSDLVHMLDVMAEVAEVAFKTLKVAL